MGTGLERVCLWLVCSVWVLDFMQERFHNMHPGDFGRTFVTAGDSEAKGGLRAEEATGERLAGAALALRRG